MKPLLPNLANQIVLAGNYGLISCRHSICFWPTKKGQEGEWDIGQEFQHMWKFYEKECALAPQEVLWEDEWIQFREWRDDGEYTLLTVKKDIVMKELGYSLFEGEKKYYEGREGSIKKTEKGCEQIWFWFGALEMIEEFELDDKERLAKILGEGWKWEDIEKELKVYKLVGSISE